MTMPTDLEICPECESNHVTVETVSHELQIVDPTSRDGMGTVQMQMTTLACKSCTFHWTDYRGEAERSEAALSYFQRRVKELYDEVRSLREFKRSVDEALNSGSGVYRP